MNYTTAVIRETLRKWPVVSIAIPRIPIKDVNIGGYKIPKGTNVYCA